MALPTNMRQLGADVRRRPALYGLIATWILIGFYLVLPSSDAPDEALAIGTAYQKAAAFSNEDAERACVRLLDDVEAARPEQVVKIKTESRDETGESWRVNVRVKTDGTVEDWWCNVFYRVPKQRWHLGMVGSNTKPGEPVYMDGGMLRPILRTLYKLNEANKSTDPET